MRLTWLDFSPEDALKYPYTVSETLPQKYTDAHGRNIYSLLASLSRFGHRIGLSICTRKETSQDEEAASTFIPVVTRFCEKASQPNDFRTLFENIPTHQTKSRVVFLSNALERNASEILASITNLITYEHILIIHTNSDESFSIYFFVPSRRTIDVYFIGEKNMDIATRICNALHGIYLALHDINDMTVRQRLQTPPSLPFNPTLFTYILAMSIHAHANYLELNDNTMTIQQLVFLSEMIELHDSRFGSIDSGSVNRRSHPFFDKFNPKTDHPEEVQRLGWSIFDVLGDGNCGYYSIILGLENLGNSTYSPTTHRPTYAQRMDQCNAWQTSVMQLRLDMRTHSLSMVESIFTPSNARIDWTIEICPLEEDIEALSEEFLSDGLRQREYFDYSLVNNEDRLKYQLTAIWGYIVAASLLHVRFIVYFRASHWDGVKVTYHWKTFTMVPFGDLADLFKANEGLHKISDSDFISIPTIEIMYTTGTLRGGVLEPKHYRFLRRVLQEDYTLARRDIATNETLGSYIRDHNKHMPIAKGTKRKKRKSSETVATTKKKQTSKGTNKGKSPSDLRASNGASNEAHGESKAKAKPTTDTTAAAEPTTNHQLPEKESKATAKPTTDTTAVAEPTTYQQLPENAVTTKKKKGKIPSDLRSSNGANEKSATTEQEPTTDPSEKTDAHAVEPTTETTAATEPTSDPNTETNTQAAEPGTATTAETTTEGTMAPTRQDQLQKYEKYFNNLLSRGALTHRAPTKLYYKSSTGEFFIKANIEENDVRIPCPDVNIYDPKLVRAARELPNEWLGPSLGDSGTGDAPYYLTTKVVTIYQQHANPYCLSHSLASALFYCDSQNFRIASEGLVQLGQMITGIPGIHFDAQIKMVREYMAEHVPLLGRPTLYGRRPNTHLRKLRRITWDELLLNVTPFPTVVIPRLPSGEATHAFCVVDDLIFDSTTPFALRLCRDSVTWLFREIFPELYQVIRFDHKVSPKGIPILERYNRKVQYHWEHPSRDNDSKL